MDRSTLSDMEREAILRDSTFLRVHELQNGQVQFTDSCYPAAPDSSGVLLSQNSTH